MRTAFRLLIALAAALAVLLQAGPASAQRRVALAVGIDRYDNLEARHQLRKAVADARAIGPPSPSWGSRPRSRRT